jgi:hypothetical protein
MLMAGSNPNPRRKQMTKNSSKRPVRTLDVDALNATIRVLDSRALEAVSGGYVMTVNKSTPKL